MASVPLHIKKKHNKLLVDLCDLIHINDPSYKSFIGFLQIFYIPARILESVKKEPMDVFRLMEERGILEVGYYCALEEALDASGNKQALDLVKKVESEINIHIKGLGSIKIATQGTSAAGDVSPSKSKRKISIQEASAMGDYPLSNKKRKFAIQEASAMRDYPPSNRKRKFAIREISAGGNDSPSSRKRKIDLQDEEESLEAIRNNVQKVEEIIKRRKIPKQSIMKAAVKENGYTKAVLLVLSEMSNLLKTEISQAIGVWCGYRPKDPHTPIFVVTLKNKEQILQKNKIPEPFTDYTIVVRQDHAPNDEERSIEKKYGSASVRSEYVVCLKTCIANHTERLMKEHRNLSIIRPCHVKSSGYLRKKHKVWEKTCIVFYVPVKGIIPIGEKEFPKVIDNIITDVREGEFLFFGDHNAMCPHEKLRMGCSITGYKTGSLGGFVDLPGEKVGCLTAAHVVLNDQQIKSYIDMREQEKIALNVAFANGTEQIEIHQPRPNMGLIPFGRVHTIALYAGNNNSPSVDAAIIEITDNQRKPEAGNFPDGIFDNIGFTKNDPMLYTNGNIMEDIEPRERGSQVIKFGCKTGITRGILEWIGASVRPVAAWGNYCFCPMMGQMEVNVMNFADSGDSGALVFICSGGNIRNLSAIGMIMGGSTTGSCFITPIKAVFEKLGLSDHRFKVFPTRDISEQETTNQTVTEGINIIEHFNRVEQNLNENINERLSRVERTINENMNERISSVEQNLNESLNKKLKEHLSVIQNLIESLRNQS